MATEREGKKYEGRVVTNGRRNNRRKRRKDSEYSYIQKEGKNGEKDAKRMLTKELRDQTTRSGSANSNMRRTSSSRCNEACKKEAWSSREDGTTDDRRKMKE